MNRSRIVTIIKNITFEVGKEFNIDLELKFDYDIGDDDYYTLNYNIISSDVHFLPRSLTIRYDRKQFEVSSGIHSPSDYISDTIQSIIRGRIAERFLKEFLK